MAESSNDLRDEDSEAGKETPPLTSPRPTRIRATVVYEQNRHGALTVRDDETAATYHIVQYATPALRETATGLKRGTGVELAISPVGCRANVWRVDQLAVRPDSVADQG